MPTASGEQIKQWLEWFNNENEAKYRKLVLDAFRENTKLYELNLSGSNLEVEGIKALAEGLKRNNSIFFLNLSQNNLHGNIILIAEALKSKQSLSYLTLGQNGLDDEDIKNLIEGLEYNDNLAKLDLSFNNIGDEGVKFLAELCQKNSTLSNIILFDNKISDEGATIFADIIKNNHFVTILDLERNSYGYEGIKAIAEALKFNTTLTKLGLNFDNDGLTAIAKAIKANNSLVRLRIGSNPSLPLPVVKIKTLANTISYNTSLAFLNLSHIKILDELALKEGFKENETLCGINLLNSRDSERIKYCYDKCKDNRDRWENIANEVVDQFYLSINRLINYNEINFRELTDLSALKFGHGPIRAILGLKNNLPVVIFFSTLRKLLINAPHSFNNSADLFNHSLKELAKQIVIKKYSKVVAPQYIDYIVVKEFEEEFKAQMEKIYVLHLIDKAQYNKSLEILDNIMNKEGENI